MNLLRTFHTKPTLALFVALFFQLIAFFLLIIDPEPYGMGLISLWIAPPILLVGLLLPMVILWPRTNVPRPLQLNHLQSHLREHWPAVLLFLIALGTYTYTLEPTASLWDCSEFIASAYKLQVSHTPGTPLTILMGRIFSMMAVNPSQVAWWINFMVALFSAASVWVVYHLIHFFGGRIFPDRSKFIIRSGAFCGGLILTFSDTFWFSAVEAETYGPSGFFMLLIIWLGIRLQNREQNKWLILSYLAGLSYCIHPMCLLALPALSFIFFPDNQPFNLKNILLAFIIGFGLVLVINRLIAVGLFEFSFYLDLLLVNTFGLPFYSAILLLILLMIGGYKLVSRRLPKMKIPYKAIVFLIWGFSPYLLLFIRSNHNPPIDEGNPESLNQIKAYMNRETYPSRPLIYGPYFDADIQQVIPEKTIYYKAEDRYRVAGEMIDYVYDKNRKTIFPRMYSRDPQHIDNYRKWTGLKEGEAPKFADNLAFLFKYQIGHLYFRYFMWNFAGRAGNRVSADWLKPWENEKIISNTTFHKAINQYWMLPFILGVIGFLVQLKKDDRGFLLTLVSFLATGLILAVYLNATPNEPRDRDYIFFGSYIFFAIWAGIGSQYLIGQFNSRPVFRYSVGMICLAVPLWMAYQNYDDHNRHNRTFHIDNARNLLASCEKNAILFTGGDNDTFPLWYLQEVEGYRTDVRVMVLSYFNTDWYINQLRNEYYDSPAFNLTLNEDDYRQYGLNDVIYVNKSTDKAINWRKYTELMQSNHPALLRQSSRNEPFRIIPGNTVSVSDGEGGKMEMTISGHFFSKNVLAFLDIVESNHWKRPIYFNFTSMNSIGIDVIPYLQQVGLVYKLVNKRNSHQSPTIDTSAMYQNLLVNANYNNLLNPDIYLNYEDFQARILSPVKNAFNILANQYLTVNELDKAKEVMDFYAQYIYQPNQIPSISDIQAIRFMGLLKQNENKRRLIQGMIGYYEASATLPMQHVGKSERLILNELNNHADSVQKKQIQKVINLLEPD